MAEVAIVFLVVMSFVYGQLLGLLVGSRPM